jgi:hypothetical protein
LVRSAALLSGLATISAIRPEVKAGEFGCDVAVPHPFKASKNTAPKVVAARVLIFMILKRLPVNA